jgi:5-methyltetrahydrofolate--homocysteine methyltransferase
MGPTGRFLEPFGTLSFDEAYEAFCEQAHILAEAGVDCLILETMVDLQEARAALLATRDTARVPVIAQMSFAEGGRTVTGTDAATAAVVLGALGADVIGANCQTGPDEMLPVIREMACYSSRPLVAQPNAGMPHLTQGGTVYPGTPAHLAQFAERFAEAGAGLVGSCCGSTPHHTRAIAARLGRRPPVSRDSPPAVLLSSRTRTVAIGTGCPVCVIGERINPSGRKVLSRELKAGKTAQLLRDAFEQVQAGAEALDVNVATPGVSESETFRRVLPPLQNAVSVPLVIDSTDPQALQAALRVYAGRALINSLSGDRATLEKLLPLVRRFGAAFVGLCLDGQGIPATASGRLRIAREIMGTALDMGLCSQDILIDGLVLTAATNQDEGLVTLETLERVKGDLGLCTILGVSNISYGLPLRGAMNAAFVAMAAGRGLDAAILDPRDPEVMSALRAASVISGRDRGARAYLDFYRRAQPSAVPNEKAPDPGAPEVRLREAILGGRVDGMDVALDELAVAGWSPAKTVDEILIPAIGQVGQGFARGEILLPQVILSAEAMRRAFSILRSRFGGHGHPERGKILLATVRGDLHDLGKNIVRSVLESFGFSVIDLGTDVPREQIASAARREEVDIVGLSALMTTSLVEMAAVVEHLRQEDLRMPVMVGGAVVTPGFADEIGAGYASDALGAVREAERLMKG